MRVLATFAGGIGHFLPTLPYARQLRARGHQVRYACQQAMVAVVEDVGFPAVDTGGATLLPPEERRRLSPVDRAHEQRVVADFFVARVGTERAARISALIADWRPAWCCVTRWMSVPEWRPRPPGCPRPTSS